MPVAAGPPRPSAARGRGPHKYRRGEGEASTAGETATLSLHSMLPMSTVSVRTGTQMATLTIRNLDDSVKARLRLRAAGHGRSMEEEARAILGAAVAEEAVQPNLADLALALFGRDHGVDLEPPGREPMREPPDFER
jgi:plasmid stability protein